VLHSVVPLGEYEALDYIDPAESARRLAASGIEIMPAGSLPAYREPPMTRPIPVLR